MTYGYENLNDDRFQQLCQAVLTTVHKDVQCLPVGQPDGGRDAFVRNARTSTRQEPIVYQVKFSKNPGSKDERDVIAGLIKTEYEKVNILKERGLEKYYLLTNVSGTSHDNVGSIDKVNEELTEKIGVEAYCWWRDDLDRRIDANSSIKWSFPEILRGTDILEGLYKGKFEAANDRRILAIRAYLAQQYKYDAQLKFKQVDLEKGLADLFVDVPASAVAPLDPREREKWRERFEESSAFSALAYEPAHRHMPDHENRIGTVEALVQPSIAKGLPRVVIEGAPGQGKSTVTQFLCQLHRMILLKKDSELQSVPDSLRPQDVRLPLRVDLRDYATWLSGRSPFSLTDAAGPHESLSPALESFLAAQISSQSGGIQFSPEDLLASASQSSLLVVLDGFDEVADIQIRNRLVKEISDASTRLEGNSISNQFIVTSRPAAFANSPGFPKSEWQYIQILPLTRSVISAYTEKWMAGHNFDTRERQDILNVLEEKLEYPHVRELARNPMQLAILLALISTQGASLPDKRTVLYDRYIDIFLNRESEKSRIVRDNRELLIDMHRYLAWTLQVEAENDANAGNISEQRLRDTLRTYLINLGHNPELVDKLFVGMVERVVALVSRVQGTFEFEVQPLREYFAARYLYDTARYVPAGTSGSGSIMDRFDALARNAYWLNVTRFYCGCYSSGELSSLVDGLMTIGQSEQYSGTSYITDLSITLLSDYVFSQQPRSVGRLTDFILSDKSFRIMLASTFGDRRGIGIILPEGSGRAKLLEKATKAYCQARHYDTAYASAMIIKANDSDDVLMEVWTEAGPNFQEENKLYFAGFIDVIDRLPDEQIIAMVECGGPVALRTCVYRGRPDIFSSIPQLWRKFIELSLEGQASWLGLQRIRNSELGTDEGVAALLLTVIGCLTALPNDDGPHRPKKVSDIARRFGHKPEDIEVAWREVGTADSISQITGREVVNAAVDLIRADLVRNSLLMEKICKFLDLLVQEFGCRPLIIDAGVAVTFWFEKELGLVEANGVVKDIVEFRNYISDASCCNVKLCSAKDSNEALLAAKSYLAWVDGSTLTETVSNFSKLVDGLDEEDFAAVYATTTAQHGPYPQIDRSKAVAGFSDSDCAAIGVRAAALISNILETQDRDTIFTNVLRPYDGFEENIRDSRANSAWHFAHRQTDFWPEALQIIADDYKLGHAFDEVYSEPDRGALPLTEAKRIAKDPAAYPLAIVALAERLLTANTGSEAIPVGKIAARDDWFADT